MCIEKCLGPKHNFYSVYTAKIYIFYNLYIKVIHLIYAFVDLLMCLWNLCNNSHLIEIPRTCEYIFSFKSLFCFKIIELQSLVIVYIIIYYFNFVL